MPKPGDGTLGITDAELMKYFAAWQLLVTWALDGEASQQSDPQAPGP